MKFLGIIPARFASSRFPGKPLVMIGDRSMIQRVYEQASRASSLDSVIVATDDNRIYNHVLGFGGKAMMTSTHHQTGTERCAEVAATLYELHSQDPADVVINIQGDEPFIHPDQIDILCQVFIEHNTTLATLARAMTGKEDLQNPNLVKVVRTASGKALYFSRAAIPFLRGEEPATWPSRFCYLKHIGLYAYRTDILHTLVQLPPSVLEQAESLEQLRWLDYGYEIHVAITPHDSHAIDVPGDLETLTPFMI